jgi:hypothetical protein
MRILVDIGHPAHIHYFKNCARILTGKGYKFLFVVRERDSTMELIRSTGFNYVSRGKGKTGLLNKMMGIFQIDYKMYKIAKKFKPDFFLSFSSPYAAHVAWLMRKPHIAFDDTEHAKFGHWMCRPFTDVVLSPSCYYAKLWKNQILFSSYMEFCYLHPNYFKPDKTVLERIGVREGEKYCVLRFVSWDAHHDVGQKGLSYQDKLKVVEEISKDCRVFISSEEKLDDTLKPYQLRIHPKDLHSVLKYATLYVGEGSTTASEAVILGTPSVYINTLRLGYMVEDEERGLLFHPTNLDEALNAIRQILRTEGYSEEYKKKWEKLLHDKIDPTAFMVWFIENYPQSKQIMKDNPEYQNRFKSVK